MYLQATLGSLLGLLFLVDVGGACTELSTRARFRSVLSRAKLQYPDSSQSASPVELYEGFTAWQFQPVNANLLQFQVAGSSHRSELREMNKFGSEMYWAVDDGLTHVSNASISIPRQEAGIEEVTMMQVHGGKEPILRISWVQSIQIDDATYEDVVISTVRLGLGSSSKDFVKTVLAERSISLTNYQVTVENSLLSIKVNGSTTVDDQDLSFWEGDDTAYFKAGAYNNHPSDSSAVARVLFGQIAW